MNPTPHQRLIALAESLGEQVCQDDLDEIQKDPEDEEYVGLTLLMTGFFQQEFDMEPEQIAELELIVRDMGETEAMMGIYFWLAEQSMLKG